MDIVLASTPRSATTASRASSCAWAAPNISIAKAEEIGAALEALPPIGKFVIAHAQGFERRAWAII